MIDADAKAAIPEQEILDKQIEFPNGLPGFPSSTRFILSQAEGEAPFAWMRDIDDPDLAFAVIEAYHLVPDYTIEIDDEELSVINSPSAKHCAIILILRIEIDEPNHTLIIHANLRAPILINTIDHKGSQFMLPEESPYSESTVFKFQVGSKE
ncbi:MAG: flagellar assembly protein FliW [Verrucomicrobiota bacterium]